MAIFNPLQFLRHISNPNLRQFTEQHVINANLSIDCVELRVLLTQQLHRI